MINWKNEHEHRLMTVTNIKENWPSPEKWWEAIVRAFAFRYLDWWIAQTGKLVDRGVVGTGVLPIGDFREAWQCREFPVVLRNDIDEDEVFLSNPHDPHSIYMEDCDCGCTPLDAEACAAEEEMIDQMFGDTIPVPGLDLEDDRCA